MKECSVQCLLTVVTVLGALMAFESTNATSQQRSEPFPANHNPQYKSDLGVQTENRVFSRRIFVPAAAATGAATSSLILESHPHEVAAPTPAAAFARFTLAPNVPRATTSLEKLAAAVQENPVLAALLITSLLSVKTTPKPVGHNTPEHLPPDPYVALLLSHYGRYIPKFGIAGHGIYGYNAANNIHNTKPFGNYKIYDDSS